MLAAMHTILRWLRRRWALLFVPLPYLDRGCTGRAWRRAFPSAPKERIRAFLACLVDGMRMPPSAALRFRPDDRVHTIYTALYGGSVPLGDALECERFAWNLEDEFDADLDRLASVWTARTTLGELFAHVSPARAR
jgi:propanediol dehydratase small subunit